ncbi:T9SS type A sorting domain-containing protein, partial [Calditrichota bacterium]
VGLIEQSYPDIATSKQGEVGIVWIDELSGNQYPVQFIKYDVEADSFYGKITVCNEYLKPDEWRLNAEIVYDTSGHPIILWDRVYTLEGYPWTVRRMSRSYDYGASFTPPYFNQQRTNHSSPFITEDNDIYICWADRDNFLGKIKCAKFANDDTTITDIHTIDTGLLSHYYQSVLVYRDTIFAFFLGGIKDEIYYTKSINGGTSFEPISLLFSDSTIKTDCNPIVINNDIYLTFNLGKSQYDRYIYFSKSEADSFSSPIQVYNFPIEGLVLWHGLSYHPSSGFIMPFMHNDSLFIKRSSNFNGIYEEKIFVGDGRGSTWGGVPQITQDDSGNIFVVSTKEFNFYRRILFNRINMLINRIYEPNIYIVNDFNLSVFPNPFNSQLTIQFELIEAGEVNFNIYNLLGERVYYSSHKKVQSGKNTFYWKGKDRQGNSLPSGMYFIHFKSENIQKSIKVLYLK